ncbi:Uncharacterised protein [Bordetella ansorpii]|uniref:Uncharacterized protein n=1 Tax=Bordetella ansorpii TaxID=288768 RepID=A0A157NYC8_9BORD|nr:hypothetical protein [Bordetella ansorpii]SAI26211.1 Uncharacterised protein [Bordetella ansorpii]
MLGRLVRILLALTAVAPLSIPLAYLYARQQQFLWAALALAGCLALGGLAWIIIVQASRRLEPLPIAIVKAKSADKEVLAFFIAYALPLIFRNPVSAPSLDGWLFAMLLLVFVLWSTHTLQVNPVLGLLGFHFYEAEAQGGITYLLITRREITNLKSIGHVVQIGEYGVLEARRPSGASA